MAHSLFYVLNGLQDGIEGEEARHSDSTRLADGHYYLEEDEADGVGPYLSKDHAQRAAEVNLGPWSYALPLHPKEQVYLLNDGQDSGEANVVTVTKQKEGQYGVVLEGSYEFFDLGVSCPSAVHAARIARAALGEME